MTKREEDRNMVRMEEERREARGKGEKGQGGLRQRLGRK